ncbi:MAG: amidohydrolase, partial [Bacteroidia bacterium]|nr:amidohydrolase [Bacteroidia bacterium]
MHDRNRFILTLLLLVLAGCGGRLLSPEARLYSNCTGYTLVGDSLQTFTGLLVDSGKVVAVGTAAELAVQYPGVEVVDLEGKYVLPGLIDAHGHVLGLGRIRQQADLVGTASLEAFQQRVKAFAQANPASPWVLGRGWNQELWPTRAFPTARDLDAVVPDRPVALERVDGHATLANSRALALAGIGRQTPDPVGGKIVRDPLGNPTGLLIDRAADLLIPHLPKQGWAQDSLALELALAEMRRLGLTSVHDAGIDSLTYRLYQHFADRGALSTRIYAMIGGVGPDFDYIAQAGPQPSVADDALSVRSVKLYADGALGSRGAALLAPYTDQPASRGLPFQSLDKLIAKIKKATDRGYQVNVHAIGDSANRQVLSAFATIGKPELRPRIEHAQVVAPDDFGRFKALGVIASVQPTHATSDKNMAEDRLGPERIRGAYAWQALLAAGVRLAAGSDFPVEGANPFWGLYAAVTRQDTAAAPPGGWYPQQRLSRAQALHAFTLGAAYAAHQERVLGSLEPGKWADFIVVDRDYTTCPEADIWRTQVLATYQAGR